MDGEQTGGTCKKKLGGSKRKKDKGPKHSLGGGGHRPAPMWRIGEKKMTSEQERTADATYIQGGLEKIRTLLRQERYKVSSPLNENLSAREGPGRSSVIWFGRERFRGGFGGYLVSPYQKPKKALDWKGDKATIGTTKAFLGRPTE